MISDKMVVRSSSKSSTAQPSPPNMSQTSTQTSTSTINWQPGESDSYSMMKDMESRNKKDISRSLANDRSVIKTARDAVAKQHGFHQLDEQEQERRMKEAALNRVRMRINNGQYTSCTYPIFAGFIPKIVFGSTDGSKDPDKEDRMVRQLADLRKKFARGQQDSDDDYDEDEDEIVPPSKNEKGGIKQEMSDVPPYAERNESKPSKHSSCCRGKANCNSNEKGTTASQQAQESHTAPHSSKRKRSDDSDGDGGGGGKKRMITWRAVSRGQPLPEGAPAPEFEQWKPKVNPWLGRVVFQGQVLDEDAGDED